MKTITARKPENGACGRWERGAGESEPAPVEKPSFAVLGQSNQPGCGRLQGRQRVDARTRTRQPVRLDGHEQWSPAGTIIATRSNVKAAAQGFHPHGSAIKISCSFPTQPARRRHLQHFNSRNRLVAAHKMLGDQVGVDSLCIWIVPEFIRHRFGIDD